MSLLASVCDDMANATFCLGPDAPHRFAFSAQVGALRRCIVNLIDNAVKYGTARPRVVRNTPDAIRIVVDDDGPGIPPAEVEGVFRPFRRLDASRNRETGGTGLGLTIARTVAREHGGDVTLENRPEGGLRATILLPLEASRGAEKRARAQLSRWRNIHAATGSVTTLITTSGHRSPTMSRRRRALRDRRGA